MAFYAASTNNSAPGTTFDLLTLTAPASRITLCHEVSISGEGSASAANELLVNRPSTLGVTAGSTLVSAQIDPDSVASAAQVVPEGAAGTNGWTTAPVLGAVSMLRLGCNSNGGVYRWVAKPGEEMRLRNNTTVSVSQLSFRCSLGGSQQMGLHIFFEEL